nr:immunoglobulin heavy chain junction region [Mus musculus]NSM05039.1 immunoglobulin heavy chain junction region [Mus musculus]
CASYYYGSLYAMDYW